MKHENFFDWLRKQRDAVRHIAVLTGAGISAESGIPTFRGTDGLWRGKDPAELFTPEALADDPLQIWQFYDELRTRIARAEPNAGHRALAALAQGRAVTIATQNIDGLHQRAGSREVIELHGTLWALRCAACAFAAEDTRAPLPALPPRCPRCDGILRPDIVLYTEALPAPAVEGAWHTAQTCDLMLVVGTSGVVYPAAGLPRVAQAHGATLVEINPYPTALSAAMDYALRAPATVALPQIVETLHG